MSERDSILARERPYVIFAVLLVLLGLLLSGFVLRRYDAPVPAALESYEASAEEGQYLALVGSWSFSDFHSAMKLVIRRDGAHLYSAFPYLAFAKLSDADIADVATYVRNNFGNDAGAVTPEQVRAQL